MVFDRAALPRRALRKKFHCFTSYAGDRHGHKLNVLLYCFIYAASCLIAHSSWLPLLLVGRGLAGMAYSLLFTAFESWAVAEVDAKGLGRACLSNVFGAAVATSAIAAVLSGVIGAFPARTVCCTARPASRRSPPDSSKHFPE